MVTGLGNMDINNPLRKKQLYSEIGTSATAKASVATTASKVRSSGKPLNVISQSTGVSSGSIFFTKALRRPTIARYQSAAGISRALNGGRQNYRYISNLATTGIATQNATYMQSSQSTASSFGEALGALAGLITAGAGAAKTMGWLDGKSNSQKIDNAMDNLSNTVPSNVSSDVASYIKSMESANNSTKLRNAIASANDQVGGMETNIASLDDMINGTNGYKNKQVSLENKQGNLEGQVKSLETKKGEQESVVSSTEKQLSTAKSNLETADKKVVDSNSAYKTASEKYTTAQANTKKGETRVSTAETGVANAKANLAQAKLKLNPDGTQDQAAIAAAQKELEAAEKELNDAKEALNGKGGLKEKEQEALNAKKEAANNLDESTNEAKEAKKAVQDALAEVDKQQGQLEKATKSLEETKAELEPIEKELAEVKDEIALGEARASMLEEAKTNKDSLEQTIAKQNKRLAKMENDEAKALTKADKNKSSDAKVLDGRTSDSEVIRDAIKYDKGNSYEVHQGTKKGDSETKYYKITNPKTGNTFYYKKVGGEGMAISKRAYETNTGQKGAAQAYNPLQTDDRDIV